MSPLAPLSMVTLSRRDYEAFLLCRRASGDEDVASPRGAMSD